MPNIVRTERWPGSTPGRLRPVKILGCTCGQEVRLLDYSGTACACGCVYNTDGWQIASIPKETET